MDKENHQFRIKRNYRHCVTISCKWPIAEKINAFSDIVSIEEAVNADYILMQRIKSIHILYIHHSISLTQWITTFIQPFSTSSQRDKSCQIQKLALLPKAESTV